jgi:hypothetical protein
VKVLVYAQGDQAQGTLENAALAAHLCGLQAMVFDTEKKLLSEAKALEEQEARYLLVTGVDERDLAKALIQEGVFCKTSVLLCTDALTPAVKRDLVLNGSVRHLVPWTQDQVTALAPTLHRLAYPAAWPLVRSLRFPLLEGRTRVLTHKDVQRFKSDLEREIAVLTALSPRGVRDGFIQRAHQVIDELTDNALRALLRDENDEGYMLSTWNSVELAFACDGASLGLSVSDGVGSLEPWTFFRSLFEVKNERQENNKATSLGIGLRVTLSMASAVCASVSPGSSTTVQAYLPIERSLKSFGTRPKRVEYFSP